VKNSARPTALLLASCVLLAIGCGTGSAETSADGPGETAEAASEAPTSAPAPAALPSTELAASHVLIAYRGANRAADSVTRTRDEALVLADEIAQKAKSGEDFAALAAEYSDGPTATRGGDLGIFAANRMVPEFSQACLAMEVGGISDPVETQFGFHVIQRNAVDKVAARHILVMHNGSQRKPPTIDRTEAEALARCEEIAARAKAGEDFEALAREYSDGPSGPRGGDLGSFGHGAMVPAFDEAVFALEVGGVSEVVVTPFGCHVIQRYQ
jgi:peptidyl-prolyl cis-trans isomerase SurA